MIYGNDSGKVLTILMTMSAIWCCYSLTISKSLYASQVLLRPPNFATGGWWIAAQGHVPSDERPTGPEHCHGLTRPKAKTSQDTTFFSFRFLFLFFSKGISLIKFLTNLWMNWIWKFEFTVDHQRWTFVAVSICHSISGFSWSCGGIQHDSTTPLWPCLTPQ